MKGFDPQIAFGDDDHGTALIEQGARRWQKLRGLIE
jgi:hypothetical protein